MAAVSRLCVLAVVGLAAVGLFADAQTAPACDAPQANDVYARDACTGYADCETTLCGCVGSTYVAPPGVSCMANTTEADCTAYLACYQPFQVCVDALAAFAGDTSNDCYTFASALHTQMLLIAQGTPYAGSDLQVSCVYAACSFHAEAPSMDQQCTYLGSWDTVCVEPTPPVTPVPGGTPPVTPAPEGNETPMPNETNETTPAPNATSGAAAMSTAVLAAVAALAMLL